MSVASTSQPKSTSERQASSSSSPVSSALSWRTTVADTDRSSAAYAANWGSCAAWRHRSVKAAGSSRATVRSVRGPSPLRVGSASSLRSSWPRSSKTCWRISR